MTTSKLNPTDQALFARQSSEICAVLDRCIPANQPVAFIPFPFDGNVGNHMMWIAVNTYLKSRGIRVAYTAQPWTLNTDHLKRAIGDGTIIFLGGVSVSRLWPWHAEVKRKVAAACPSNRLVSLPSTMILIDDEDRAEASSLWEGHSDAHMLARDELSARSGGDAFPKSVSVETVHDTAFMLPPQPRNKRAVEMDVIWLARNDHEGAGFAQPEDIMVFDWPSTLEPYNPNVLASRVCSKVRDTVPGISSVANRALNSAYMSVSKTMLRRGNQALDRGRVLVTDRLHPHVLAALRGQYCVMLPDLYGKNRAVWDYSSEEYSTIFWADTPEEALDLARSLATKDAAEDER